MAKIEIKTAPADFRFPTTNQTRHCFTRYIEFHRCVAAKGDESGDCDKFAQYYRFARENGLRNGMSRGRMEPSQGHFNSIPPSQGFSGLVLGCNLPFI